MNIKKCNRCKRELPATKEYFYSDKSKKDGLTTLCKKCKSEREIIYLKSDIGKIIDSNDTKKVGIYKITNLVNNHIYIGSTVNLYRRKNEHLKELRHNKHYNKHLQNAFNKYGEDNFQFTILEFVFELNNLINREQYWIDYYKSNDKNIGYNIREKAENNVNLTTSDETKRRISQINKGKIVSEETKRKLSEINKGKKRKYPVSQETRDKLSNANKGRIVSKETRKKMSESKKEYFKNHPLTEEDRKLRSERMKGNKNPHYGKKPSLETILKYSKKVLQYDKNNNFIREYISLQETKNFGFDPREVSKCCRGKKEQYKKYFWKFKDNQKPSS